MFCKLTRTDGPIVLHTYKDFQYTPFDPDGRFASTDACKWCTTSAQPHYALRTLRAIFDANSVVKGTRELLSIAQTAGVRHVVCKWREARCGRGRTKMAERLARRSGTLKSALPKGM